MGNLKWKNDSSQTVKWFFITELGSQSALLNPGEELCLPNHPDIKSTGMLCTKGPVHVINYLETACDSELIATDYIPMSTRDDQEDT
jgi:hypothetical protein